MDLEKAKEVVPLLDELIKQERYIHRLMGRKASEIVSINFDPFGFNDITEEEEKELLNKWGEEYRRIALERLEMKCKSIVQEIESL